MSNVVHKIKRSDSIEFDKEDEKYLEKVLSVQQLKNDDPEMLALAAERKAVETLIQDNFGTSNPQIRYGGSKAKGTMNKVSYDLDLPCYFAHDGDNPGETLKEIFEAVADVLEATYVLERKTSAIRLLSKSTETFRQDLHIDVVPGRFVDSTKGDCFLYINSIDRERLKTNLDIHIRHIRDSGQSEIIRLAKLWKVVKCINIKTFPLELLTVKLLQNYTGDQSRQQRLLYVWRTLRDAAGSIALEDPANPEGNDLREIWNGPTPIHRLQRNDRTSLTH